MRFAEEAEACGLGVRKPIEFVGVPLEEVQFMAWMPYQGYTYLPINFLVGKGVTLEGSIGHVKSAVDSMLRRGQLNQVIWLNGTPTIMVGEVEDPHFEEHLKEGPYIVVDDAALPEHKNDPQVHFIGGHPVRQTTLPELLKGLGVEWPGNAAMRWQQFERWGMHNVHYGSPRRKALTIGQASRHLCICPRWLCPAAMMFQRRGNSSR